MLVALSASVQAKTGCAHGPDAGDGGRLFRGEPIVQFGSHPIRNRNRSDVASLADQINNGPMLFALLEMIQSQRHGFMPRQAAREQQCE
jgi:hypothetical protein